MHCARKVTQLLDKFHNELTTASERPNVTVKGVAHHKLFQRASSFIFWFGHVNSFLWDFVVFLSNARKISEFETGPRLFI